MGLFLFSMICFPYLLDLFLLRLDKLFPLLFLQAERRRKLGLPPEDTSAVKSSAPVVEEKKVRYHMNKCFCLLDGIPLKFVLMNNEHLFVSKRQSSLPIRPATKVEQMRECLRSLKQNHKVNRFL